jgi:hypothetical protein
MTQSRLFLCTVCLFSAVLLPACKDVKPPVVQRGTVTVRVVPSFFKIAPTRISVFAPDGKNRGPELYTYLVGEDGLTGFVLPMDKAYEFRAFVDANHNGKQDPGEPAGVLSGVKPDPDVNKAKPPLDLLLSAGAAPPDKAASGGGGIELPPSREEVAKPRAAKGGKPGAPAPGAPPSPPPAPAATVPPPPPPPPQQ